MRRRIKRILFSLIIIISLGACGAKDDLTSEGSNSNLPVLKIGSAVFAPYFYMGEDGEYTGIDKEIAKEACKRMGYQPEFVPFTWGEQDEMLKEGKIDCIWSCFSSQGREEQYLWSESYLKIRDMVVVISDNGIENLEDLNGKRVAVRVGTKVQDYFLKNATRETPKPELISTFVTMEDVFAAFGKGYVDAVAGPEAGLKSFTDKNPDRYRYLPEPILVIPIAVAFEKEQNSDIVENLNQKFSEMKADGTIPAIVEKYGLNEEEYGKDDAQNEE